MSYLNNLRLPINEDISIMEWNIHHLIEDIDILLRLLREQQEIIHRILQIM